jgi:undecaprenyl-diphosphatase
MMFRFLTKKISRLYAAVTLLSVEILILFLAFSAALALFIFTAWMIFGDNKTAFDQKVFSLLSTHVSRKNTGLMQFFTFLGTHTFLIPAILILSAYFLFVKKHRWYSINVPSVALSSLLVMFTLKFIFRRDRPLTPLLAVAKGYSFPSGHAMISFTFYGLLIYLVWKNVKTKWVRLTVSIMLGLLIFVIGVSRIYLRVHYASDVLAGFCVGCMWLLLSLWILRKIENFNLRKVDHMVESSPGDIKENSG